MLKKLILCLMVYASAEACTAFQLKSQDGAVVYCRSMEFAFPLDSDFLIVPKGTSFTGTAPQGTGLKWSVKYGYAGMNQRIDRTLVSDGMNEKGLVVGCLYLPGYAEYEAPDAAKKEKTLGPWELTSYILGTCATLNDVKAALKDCLVAQQPVPNLAGFIIPLHFYIGDQNGQVLIVEYVGGQRYEYENPIGALTNAPPFDWQMTNLGSYVNLNQFNVSPMQLSNYTVRGFGQGTGALGLPGDYTPPSRFVRAALFSQWALPMPTAEEAVRLGFHVLNTFNIFEGAVRDAAPKKSPFGELGVDKTEWAVVYDKTNLKAYFRTYKSLRIQMVDLKKLDFSKAGMKMIALDRSFQVDDSTNNAQPLQK
jgi:choloylglycine hydrolase